LDPRVPYEQVVIEGVGMTVDLPSSWRAIYSNRPETRPFSS